MQTSAEELRLVHTERFISQKIGCSGVNGNVQKIFACNCDVTDEHVAHPFCANGIKKRSRNQKKVRREPAPSKKTNFPVSCNSSWIPHVQLNKGHSGTYPHQ